MSCHLPGTIITGPSGSGGAIFNFDINEVKRFLLPFFSFLFDMVMVVLVLIESDPPIEEPRDQWDAMGGAKFATLPVTIMGSVSRCSWPSSD
jgi:hypothetical protein